jgi:inosine/xanthosine triphosphate pyrophosphatase family protein
MLLGPYAGLPSSYRGRREFYWDTVFIPEDPTGRAADKTYAEIVDDPGLGLEHKVLHLSQSFKALRHFLEYVRANSIPKLWSIA